MDLIIISLKINLFSPWYSWKIAELALNNNHSRTHLIEWIFGFVIISFYDSLFLNINYMMKLKTISFLIKMYNFLLSKNKATYIINIQYLFFPFTFIRISYVNIRRRRHIHGHSMMEVGNEQQHDKLCPGIIVCNWINHVAEKSLGSRAHHT